MRSIHRKSIRIGLRWVRYGENNFLKKIRIENFVGKVRGEQVSKKIRNEIFQWSRSLGNVWG
jgi:hypothetical protein